MGKTTSQWPVTPSQKSHIPKYGLSPRLACRASYRFASERRSKRKLAPRKYLFIFFDPMVVPHQQAIVRKSSDETTPFDFGNRRLLRPMLYFTKGIELSC